MPGITSIEDRFPRPSVVGVVNVTPDSFSDGGDTWDTRIAIARGLEQFADGAAIVDIGGESTRPGAEPVDPSEELRRVIGVVEELSRLGATVSIDTRNAAVARAAVAAGASLVNDVSALRHDPHMAGVVADAGVGLCLMHMLGDDPRTMQDDPRYDDVVDDVASFLEDRLAEARRRGDPRGAHLPRSRHRLRQDASTTTSRCSAGSRASRGSARPLLVGVSRKSLPRRLTRRGAAEGARRRVGRRDRSRHPRRGEPPAGARRHRDDGRARDRARPRGGG